MCGIKINWFNHDKNNNNSSAVGQVFQKSDVLFESGTDTEPESEYFDPQQAVKDWFANNN